MGISYGAAPVAVVRTGSERATLVRRTYMLVFAGVLVTMLGVSWALSTPAVLAWTARHPILSMIAMFAPLMAAMKFRTVFPTNIGLVFLFTFVSGITIAPVIYLYDRMQPGVVGQAAFLTGTTFGILTLYAFASRRPSGL